MELPKTYGLIALCGQPSHFVWLFRVMKGSPTCRSDLIVVLGPLLIASIHQISLILFLRNITLFAIYSAFCSSRAVTYSRLAQMGIVGLGLPGSALARAGTSDGRETRLYNRAGFRAGVVENSGLSQAGMRWG